MIIIAFIWQKLSELIFEPLPPRLSKNELEHVIYNLLGEKHINSFKIISYQIPRYSLGHYSSLYIKIELQEKYYHQIAEKYKIIDIRNGEGKVSNDDITLEWGYFRCFDIIRLFNLPDNYDFCCGITWNDNFLPSLVVDDKTSPILIIYATIPSSMYLKK